MAIKTGIGIGEAQVYDTSSLINNFAKLLQKQQQDEARFQTEIADILTRVDTKGVRDQDKAEIAKMYAATKDLYTQAANTKNFKDKALLKAEISKAVRDINEYAANSVNFSKKFADLNNRIAQDYYAYDPKVLDKLRDVGSKSLIEMGPDSQLDPFQYLKMPDAKIRDTFFNDIYKNAENFAKSSRVDTGKGFYESIKTASDDQLLNNIQIKLSSNPEYRKLALSTLRQQNPQAAALDAESLIKALLAQELALYKQTKGNIYRSAERQYRKEPKGDTIIIGGDSMQPKSFVSEDIVKRDKDGNPVVNKSGRPVMVPGKKVLDFSKFVSVNPEQFSMPQLGKRLNISSGIYEEFKPSGNVEIVGVGTRTGSNAYNVVVKDKDGVEYMVTEQDLPLGIRNNKIYKAARASVYVPRATQPTPSPKPKSSSDPLGIFNK